MKIRVVIASLAMILAAGFASPDCKMPWNWNIAQCQVKSRTELSNKQFELCIERCSEH